MSDEVENLYNESSNRWVRNKPTSLSDFTARQRIFELLEGTCQGLDVVDVGCGEGYCSRWLLDQGVASVKAFDLSEEMIARAQSTMSDADGGRVDYTVGDASKIDFSDGVFDLGLGVFVYNYMDVSAMKKSMAEVYRILRDGGRFVFSVPHPSLPFLGENQEPFYFDQKGKGYFESRDEVFEGEIWRLDGVPLGVMARHKLIDDYFTGLAEAGFSKMPLVEELGVRPEHLEEHGAFFGPIAELPLHLLFQVEK
jgi:SAM-dependent methyltransferase